METYLIRSILSRPAEYERSTVRYAIIQAARITEDWADMAEDLARVGHDTTAATNLRDDWRTLELRAIAALGLQGCPRQCGYYLDDDGTCRICAGRTGRR